MATEADKYDVLERIGMTHYQQSALLALADHRHRARLVRRHPQSAEEDRWSCMYSSYPPHLVTC